MSKATVFKPKAAIYSVIRVVPNSLRLNLGILGPLRYNPCMSMETGLPYLHALELPTPFPVGPITVYLADAPGEPLTLIDTGPRTADTLSALEEAFAALGHSPADLRRIVLTHAHVDHFGLAGDLVARSGATVWTHPSNIDEVAPCHGERERRVNFYQALLQQAAVPPEMMHSVDWVTRGMTNFARPVSITAPVNEGDTLPLAGRRWQVLHTPGHARGLICLYEPASQTLISSDHLLAEISSNPVVEPPLPGQTERSRSLALYQDSLRRVAALPIDRALPGHGPLIDDVPGLIERRLAFHRQRMARILQALRDGATTWDLVQSLFPTRSPLDTFLAVSEVIGHLDLLELEGQIAAREESGILYWSRT